MNSNEFYNQPAVDWARQNLSKPVEIKLRFGSRLGTIFTYLLVFIVPLLFIIFGIIVKIKDMFIPPVSEDAALTSFRALACGFVLLIPFGIIALIGVLIRAKFAKLLDVEGVKSSRQKFLWAKLYYVDHVSKIIKNRGRIYDNQLELVFANGKVIIPPLIQERERIWNLINTLPAQVRDDGVIRENKQVESSSVIDEIMKIINEPPKNNLK